MFRRLSLVTSLIVLFVFLSGSLYADNTNSLLKGIGKDKQKRKPSIGLLLRDDLKALFKDVMTAYFAEDSEKYLSYFTDSITMGSRTLHRKKAQTTKDELKKRITREFKLSDYTGIAFDDAFDSRSPTMMFVMSQEQMEENIPVWGFGIEHKEIAKYMKPGDFLVIANTLPEASESVMLPMTYYMIIRKVEGKFKVVGID